MCFPSSAHPLCAWWDFNNTSLANALSLELETGVLPRPQPVDPVLVAGPDAWELGAHWPDGFGQPMFPSNNTIPFQREREPYWLLSRSKGICGNCSMATIQKYWKYAYQYAVQNSLPNSEYCSWDEFAEELVTVDLSDVT